MSSSSTTAISIVGTVTLPGMTQTIETVLTSVLTTAFTYTTTITATVSVPIGQPTPTTDLLTTYTTVNTHYETTTVTGSYPTIPTLPAPTIITGGVGQVSGVTIIGAIYELWMYFLCPSQTCSPWREWLTFIPNVAAGWVLGALALILGLGLLIMALKCGGLEFIFGFLSMLFLCICLWLRAALKHSSGSLFTMYKVSLWFNYFAAALMAMLIVQLIFRLVIHLDNTLCGAVRGLVGFVYFIALVLFALLTAAIVLMFNLTSFAKMHSGIQCLQAFVVIMLILAVILLLATAWASSNDVKSHHMGHVIIIGLCVLFLLVWACFMTARAFLGLSSAGRHSEALWYVFNIAPLLLIALVLLALNAPAMFTFCHCQVNACPVCNPHVAYGNAGVVHAAPISANARESNVNRFYM
ncbi:hypothetical protein LPJ66_003296 [Kickxella alabastrina]|uniref:Uncharacterized protein n=1 Tax=Kickxella alabastrina TaxID=61397 RepID=A0ACC1IMG4_9FUNG|nr:hypothetical protein LPJ66_003296 [Kickxella alabastrina]